MRGGRHEVAALVIGAMLAVGVPLAGGSLTPAAFRSTALRVCAAAGPYWPTMTLALRGRRPGWRARSRRGSSAGPSGRHADGHRDARRTGHRGRRRARLHLGTRLGIHALSHRPANGTRHQADPTRCERGVQHLARRRARSGSPTIRDHVCSGSPRRQPRHRPYPVGDGPADMVFAGTGVAPDHRDNTLYRIDATSNEATLLSTLGGAMRPPNVWRCSEAASGSRVAASRSSRSIQRPEPP